MPALPHSPTPEHRYRGLQPALRKSWRPAATLDPKPHFCHVKVACGGCKYVNTDYATGLGLKHEAELRVLAAAGLTRGLKTLPPVTSPRPFEYRTLFKLAVRAGVHSRFAIGLFQPGTHLVGAPMDNCPVHASSLTQLLRDLRAELEISALTPYAESFARDEIPAEQRGDLRYLVARAAHQTNEIQLVFVVTHLSPDTKVALKRITAKLRERGHKLASVHANINTTNGNAIFGDTTEKLAGTSELRERMNGLDFDVAPTSFFQINPWQASQLYHRVTEFAQPRKAVSGKAQVAWDLYSGNGQIALQLARLGWRVMAVEENPEAAASARHNASRNGLSEQIHVHAARVEDAETDIPSWANSPDLIVANPSRRGLHESARSLVQHTLRLNDRASFIYVSCAVETMARDLAALVAAGNRVRHLEAFDMFAQTDQLEWLAVVTPDAKA